jgi:hypothetical protein
MFDTLPADEQMADIGGTENPVEVSALETVGPEPAPLRAPPFPARPSLYGSISVIDIRDPASILKNSEKYSMLSV